MFYIMPGSSHWFQVHDQLPFANLKKNMAEAKNRVSPIHPLPREERRKLLLAIFYDAERKAFTRRILQKSFADVGLWPWNPARIYKICEENSPPQPSVYFDQAVNELIEAIKDLNRKKESLQRQLLSSLKPATLSPMKRTKLTESEKQEGAEESDNDDDDPTASESRLSTDIAEEPARKRRRISHRTPVKCSAIGCEKTHFHSKKWLSCPKCKKQFCPKHYQEVHYHSCK